MANSLSLVAHCFILELGSQGRFGTAQIRPPGLEKGLVVLGNPHDMFIWQTFIPKRKGARGLCYFFPFFDTDPVHCRLCWHSPVSHILFFPPSPQSCDNDDDDDNNNDNNNLVSSF